MWIRDDSQVGLNVNRFSNVMTDQQNMHRLNKYGAK